MNNKEDINTDMPITQSGTKEGAANQVGNAENAAEEGTTNQAANAEIAAEEGATSDAANAETAAEEGATNQAANAEIAAEEGATSEAANAENAEEDILSHPKYKKTVKHLKLCLYALVVLAAANTALAIVRIFTDFAGLTALRLVLIGLTFLPIILGMVCFFNLKKLLDNIKKPTDKGSSPKQK